MELQTNTTYNPASLNKEPNLVPLLFASQNVPANQPTNVDLITFIICFVSQTTFVYRTMHNISKLKTIKKETLSNRMGVIVQPNVLRRPDSAGA
jgi:hypothetical protein